ncbi:MAG: hypothetical protein LBI12_03460 [Treponema sp.]|jgi:hypothetical protein|nr:hypothetical protein [Treponema sp.]
MKEGIGTFLWKISVALYLIANGVLGLSKGGDFKIIFDHLLKGNAGIFIIIAGVIALVAGVAIILEMFNIKLSFLETLIFIIAIIWVVFVIVELVTWITGGYSGSNLWHVLQKLAVHLMVLASLLIASKKFG